MGPRRRLSDRAGALRSQACTEASLGDRILYRTQARGVPLSPPGGGRRRRTRSPHDSQVVAARGVEDAVRPPSAPADFRAPSIERRSMLRVVHDSSRRCA